MVSAVISRLIRVTALRGSRSAYTLKGGISYHCDPSMYQVKIPGTVDTPENDLDPADGWPRDPFVFSRRALAMNSLAMYRANIKISPGNLITYDEVLEVEKQVKAIEMSMPDRFQVVMAADRKTVELKIPADPLTETLVLYTSGRITTQLVYFHRLFITPRPGIPPHERERHLRGECE